MPASTRPPPRRLTAPPSILQIRLAFPCARSPTHRNPALCDSWFPSSAPQERMSSCLGPGTARGSCPSSTWSRRPSAPAVGPGSKRARSSRAQYSPSDRSADGNPDPHTHPDRNTHSDSWTRVRSSQPDPYPHSAATRRHRTHNSRAGGHPGPYQRQRPCRLRPTPSVVSATVSDPSGVQSASVILFHTTAGQVAMTNAGGNTWRARQEGA